MQLLARFWPILALIAFVIVAKIVVDEYNSAQQDVATTKAVVVQQGKVIDNAVQANGARNAALDPTKLGPYCGCLRTARTPGSCQRYLPVDAEDHDKPASLCPKP
jgi:hypothetical protein